MKRVLATLCLASWIPCFSSMPLLAGSPLPAEIFTSTEQMRHHRGLLIVEVRDISSRNPEAGIRVELLQTGQTKQTAEDGRVSFVVPPGEYDVLVYDLSGPGPARRNVDEHAVVRRGRTVIVTVFDCQLCV